MSDTLAAPRAGARLRRWKAGIPALLRSAVSPLLVVIAWEASARLGLLSPFLLPAFSDVVASFFQDVRSGVAFIESGKTLYRAMLGYSLAAVIGVPLGIAMARSKIVAWWFEPFISIGFPMPKIALLPIFILWFGLFDLSKVIMIAFSSIFPIVGITQAGVNSMEKWPIWSARSLGASERQIVMEVVLPASLPSIFTALQIAAPTALIVTIVSEMMTGSDGLGGVLLQSGRFANSVGVFSGVIKITILGYIVIKGLELLRRACLRWHVETRAK